MCWWNWSIWCYVYVLCQMRSICLFISSASQEQNVSNLFSQLSPTLTWLRSQNCNTSIRQAMQHSHLNNLIWKSRQENSQSTHPSICLPKTRIGIKKRAAWASNRQLLEILKWTADFCKARQTVLQNTVFMPALAKVSWQVGHSE